VPGTMLKFIWGRGQGPTAERIKLQKELFNFSKNVTFGFPSKPSCLAWDPVLKLLALGTKGGQVRVFGRPGVELGGSLETGGEEEPPALTSLLWLEGQGRLVSCTQPGNSLQLWEVDSDKMVLKGSTRLEGRLKTVSCLCEEKGGRRLLVGTEGGNIYLLKLWNMTWEDEIIYQDVLMRGVPDNVRVNPGAVEGLLVHPANPNIVAVGYTRGLVLLWNRESSSLVHTLVSGQQLESLCWRGGGSSLLTSHNDGSFIVWDSDTGEQLEPPNTPYGPYPCKAVGKIYSRVVEGGAWNIFSGGMPRASYGDKFTVSVMRQADSDLTVQEEGEAEGLLGEKHSVFDLSSKVVDFVVVEGEDEPSHLLILSEEELVCVSLVSWGRVLPSPYLQSLHASAITALTQVNRVNNEVLAVLESLKGEGQAEGWPVTGGELVGESGIVEQTVIVTGHEDGSVKVWGARGHSLTHFTTLETKKFFRSSDEPELENGLDSGDSDSEEEWPPFKSVGQFDPYSDDPRLAVKKVLFCGDSGLLVVGGTAGQVLVCERAVAGEVMPVVCRAETVTEKEGFTWKGHKALEVRHDSIKCEAGLQPSAILQVSPPASITSLTLSREWGVLSCGTAHGLVILDYNFQHVVTARSTLSAADIANADDNPMSRKKSLKKSLRESFRRLRKGRSQRGLKNKDSVTSSSTGGQGPIKIDSPTLKPVERQVEARSGSEDGLGSMVRCLHFSSTYIASSMGVSPSLWAGTNSGQVLVFLLTITPRDKRKNDKITAVLAKEIQLKHRAPVIDIEVQDAGGLPVSGSQPSYPAPHRVLITSEEQFKLFLLPNLKPCGKYKLTAHEGVRVRRVRSATFTSSRDQEYTENCLVYLANSGEIGVLSIPDLRRQVSSAAIRKEDVVGISSLTFSDTGNGLYMSSSSELQQISLSARNTVTPGGGRVVVSRSCDPLTAVDREVELERDRESADRQNRINEREAANGERRSPSEAGETLSQHNETVGSEASGDITLDSIRDHMSSTLRQGQGGSNQETVSITTISAPDTVAVQSTEVSVVERDLGGGRQETVETVSRTVETISVQTSQIAVSNPSA